MLEGNGRDGTFAAGPACELVREVKSAAAVVRDIMEEADQVLARLSARLLLAWAITTVLMRSIHSGGLFL